MPAAPTPIKALARKIGCSTDTLLAQTLSAPNWIGMSSSGEAVGSKMRAGRNDTAGERFRL